uniref:Ig-like domain-containing protein n=1 Tax=Sander lucioperca TaxID=283035 RepID=A0A8C9Z567_SANLU
TTSALCSTIQSIIKDRVIQPTGDVITTEGETVTLDCTYETTASFSYLFWYKQEVNGFPRFILQVYSGAKDAEVFQKDRMYDKTKILLQISSAAVSDSAVYYCALRPTVTGNTKTLLIYLN